MAAPADKNSMNFTGKWAVNKTMSDSAEPALALQGIGFLLRKAVGLASIVVEITQFEGPPTPPNTDTAPVSHVVLTQTASGLQSTKEARCLDNVFRDHKDFLFGEIKGQTRWETLDEMADEFLKGGWEVEGEGAKFLVGHVESQGNGWTATQVWGVQVVDGERRYCRNFLVAKDGKRVEFRFVYDFQGEVEA